MKDEGKRNSLIHRLKQPYRLNFLKESTFREVKSYKITPLRAILYALLVLALCLFLYTMLIIYTPLKRLIPGYGDLSSNRPYIQLLNRVDHLEKELADYRLYVENFQEMMMDSAQYVEDIARDPSLVRSEVEMVDRIPADDSLRARVNITQDLLRIATGKSLKSGKGNSSSVSEYYYAPVNGIISKGFDVADGHYGIDIIAPAGTAIKSIADGVVIFAGNTLKTGNTIAIQHDNDLVTYYMHNSSLMKKKGDVVSAGEVIAIIGNTGELTSGPHLHFEMWYKGEPLNPEKYIYLME